MSSSNLMEQIAFLSEIEKLKGIKRANKTLDGRYENSAEHSWHVAIMALLLEEHSSSSGLDILRVIKLLLIHDIVEIDAGDTWLYADDQSSKLEDETQAANRLFSILPKVQEEEYLGLWIEFEERATEEAKFAAVIDGIQPLLNHVLTGDQKDGVIALDKVRSKKKYIKELAPKLWSFVEDLIEEGVKKDLYK